MKTFYTILLGAVLCSSFYACQNEEEPIVPSISSSGFTLTAICQEAQKIKMRAVTDKTSDEMKINELNLFFFDKDGAFLEIKEDYAGMIQGHMVVINGKTAINIAKDAFTSQEKAQTATVYALANVEDGTFLNADGSCKIQNENDLLEFVYTPTSEKHRPLGKLPEKGMPMFGHKDVNLTEENGRADITLKALMARIDTTIKMAGTNEDESGTYPRLYIRSWAVQNRPLGVPLSAVASGGTTDISTIGADTVYVESTVQINNGGDYKTGMYIFENMQQPTTVNYTYPNGVTKEQYQRWKPKRANAYATSVKLYGYYVHRKNQNYAAGFTFFLGSNNIDNFEVRRNCHYANTVTITGLTNISTEENDNTFDARIDADLLAENNAYFLSILREHDHDAHFCVTPMDVYLFDEYLNPSITVTVPDDCDWIRLEKVPTTNMKNGTLPSGMTESTHLIAGNDYQAGHGKRKYFTTDLLTNTLKDAKSVTVDDNRDRIYLYIDENLSLQNREAFLTITYDDNDIEPEETQMEIGQRGLLKVEVANGNDPDYQIIYIEQIEEYLDYFDPYDAFATEHKYPGLEWGPKQYIVNKSWGSYPDTYANKYYEGLEVTDRIISKFGHGTRSLNEVPRSGAEYCYNKNKRSSSGAVANLEDNGGWFMPTIRQLEYIMTQYQNSYPPFRSEFYWSCNPAKIKKIISEYESETEARATRYNVNTGKYVESGSDGSHVYVPEYGNQSTGGRAERDVKFRIRAAYMPKEGTIE